MFDYMTKSQIASFIIAIIFSIISIATTFLVMKYSKKLNSFAKTICFSLTAPFIAGTAWIFMCFSFVEGLRKDDALNLIISLILSLFVFGMVIIVAKALYNKHGNDEEETQSEGESETTNAIADNDEKETPVVTPLLLEHQSAEKEVEDEVLNQEENIEPSEIEETQEAVENTEPSEVEETTQEIEETENEATEVEETENEAAEVEETKNEIENAGEQDADIEEIVEPNEEENKNVDEDFEKFIETLKEQIEKEKNNKNDDEQ